MSETNIFSTGSGTEVTGLAKTAENKDWSDLLLIVRLINNPQVRKFTYDFLIHKVPDYFARIPASATGKYHPQYALGYGGLVRHTLVAAATAYDISRLEYLQFTSGDQDLILASVILHDTFKQGRKESGNTERAHPNIAAQEILAYAKELGCEKLGKLIGALVVSHMGQWGNQKPGSRGQFTVHVADYIASRKYLEGSWSHLVEEANKRPPIE